MKEDINILIEQLPDSHISMPFKVRKRICTSTNGYQFLTSSYPNRNNKNKAEFYSADGLFAKGLLPGLKWYEHTANNDNRQGILVDVHISRIQQDGWQKMWVFGYTPKNRLLTPNEPQNVRRGKNKTIATVSGGSMYISTWGERDYFPDMESGSVFPVYVKVERV